VTLANSAAKARFQLGFSLPPTKPWLLLLLAVLLLSLLLLLAIVLLVMRTVVKSNELEVDKDDLTNSC
jgi:hypothetical protein